MKTLVVVGDSHTAGSEIEDKPDNGYCIDKAWGAHLAKKLNYGYINVSAPGGSNEFISRSAKTWVYDNIISQPMYYSDDVAIVIMWSSFQRQEIIYPDTGNFRFFGNGFKINSDHHKSDYNDELVQYQKYSNIFHDKCQSQYYNLEVVYGLKLFFEKYNINYKFVNGIQHFLPPLSFDMKSPYRDSYIKLLDLLGDTSDYVGCFVQEETYYKYVRDVKKFKYPKWQKYLHFGEDAHIEWANVLYSKFKDSL